jgi:hypothetical protein
MSFGLLKHFKDLKKDAQVAASTTFVKEIILGSDLGAVLKLIELRKTWPAEQVKIVSPRPIDRKLLLETHQFGVGLLRSAPAVEEIYRRHFNARILPQRKDPVFYKDGKFHEFSGRAKPMTLLAGEDFFTSRCHRLEISSLFDSETWANLDAILAEAVILKIVDAVEKTEVQELVDRKEWKLGCKDFSSLTCENLHVSMAPHKFLGLMHDQDKATAELVDFCSSSESRAAISVTFILDREIYPDDQTLFIPQSMTHDWGHFIAEFETFDHSCREQVCHVLFLIQDEEPQSEDLAAKIRLMKRVLDRVFPELERSIKKEYIRFDEDMFIGGVKDSALEQLGFDWPTLRFISQASPAPANLQQEKFLARTLLN